MQSAMYIIINKGLDMSPGKIAAQAGHAAVEAYRISDQALIDSWYLGGHYAKYVMEARDTEHLRNIQQYLEARGFKVVPIIDEGHTEVPALSYTALGVALVDKSDPHTKATFSSLKLYKDRKPKAEPPKKKRRKLKFR